MSGKGLWSRHPGHPAHRDGAELAWFGGVGERIVGGMTDLHERHRRSEPELRTTLDRVDAWWRAANHIAAGLPGGGRPAVAAATLTYAHLNRMIVRREQRMQFILGVRDALPALTAVARMEGASVSGVPAKEGTGRGRSFALAYAIGAVLDEPGLTVAALVDEDEAVSGWTAHALHDPTTDGAVLPILYQPAMDVGEVRQVFGARGWEPIEICTAAEAADVSQLHRIFAVALYVALDEIATITSAATAGHFESLARWPMLVLRTPADWPPTAPVPADWFDADGRTIAEIASAGPSGDLRMSADW